MAECRRGGLPKGFDRGSPALEAVGVNGGSNTVLQAATGVNSIPSILSGLGGISLVSMISGGGGDSNKLRNRRGEPS